MPIARFYGQFGSYWSNCNVSRGLAQALYTHGLDLDIHDERGQYNGLIKQIPKAYGPPTPIGIFVGYPALAQRLTYHPYKVGCYIAESAVLPMQWQTMLRATDLAVAPSRWMAGVFGQQGARNVQVVPHGLDPVYAQPVPAREVLIEPLRFLHIAGSRDFLWRKGTPQLIVAFAHVFSRAGAPKAILRIRTPENPSVTAAVDSTKRPDLFELDLHTEPLVPAAMRQYYLPEASWSAVIQPSRAEAFGIVPLEARALGIPVILTACTGHAQHVEPWDTIVPCGADVAMPANGIPDGRAPSVDAADIISALETFLNNRVAITAAAARGAAGYYDRWCWTTLTRKFGLHLKQVARRYKKARTPHEKLGY